MTDLTDADDVLQKQNAAEESLQGGAIRKPKKKKKEYLDPKVDEALEKQAQGGAIRKPKKKKKEYRDPKVDEALEKQAQGGRIKFFDPIHKHLHTSLSGKGGRLDPPYVRKKMHELMSAYHPSVFQSYMRGRFHDLPQHRSDHPGRKIRPTRPDPRPTVVDTGGSLQALHQSENGYLTSVDTNFYHHLEMI